MKTRIYNARILSMEPDQPIFDGEIWIDGDMISYVGPEKDGGETIWDEQIDAQRNLIMPGFKNAHTHSAMTFLRSHADDMKLDEWLNTRVFPAEAKLTGEDVYWQTKLAVMEYLTSGITSVFDMYMFRADGARAMRECGFRNVFCESINNFGGTLEQVESDYHTYNQDEDRLISYQLGFHAEYTTSREMMEGLAALSEKYQIPVYVHCSETKKEVEDCRSRTGMSPVAYMDSLGLFRHGGGLFHGVHMDEEDFDIIKKRGLYVVTNPASNLKLASGIAPVKRYLDEGIPLAIGTDGPASNNCLDMFREMFLTTGLAKLRENDASAVDADRVLEMATAGGARAMGLKDCDTLEAGKRADLVMIDLHRPNMQPENNLSKNLVYSGSKENVKLTMVDGKILYENGEFFVGEDVEKIYEKANEIIGRIQADPLFMQFMGGEKQRIMTFELFGLPWKMKMDSYLPGICITDLKVVANFRSLPAWRYDLQGAVYQAGVLAVTGEQLPFYLAAATKERVVDLDIFQIPQLTLDRALDEIAAMLPHFVNVKNGLEPAKFCGRCDYCKSMKKAGIRDYNELVEQWEKRGREPAA